MTRRLRGPASGMVALAVAAFLLLMPTAIEYGLIAAGIA
jgi:hypothetical protein